MHKRLTKLLNNYIPKIRIEREWMEDGYFRNLINLIGLPDNIGVSKDSYAISFIKFNGDDDLFGEEFCIFKIITYISTGCDAIAAHSSMENYDPNVKYAFRKADFVESAKTSLRSQDSLYIRTLDDEDTKDFCLYRDSNWDSFIIPRGMSEEEYFQNTMQYDLPPFYLFDDIYELNNVKTFSQNKTDNLGKVCYLDLHKVENTEEYFTALEGCLQFLIKLSEKLDEYRTY